MTHGPRSSTSPSRSRSHQTSISDQTRDKPSISPVNPTHKSPYLSIYSSFLLHSTPALLPSSTPHHLVLSICYHPHQSSNLKFLTPFSSPQILPDISSTYTQASLPSITTWQQNPLIFSTTQNSSASKHCRWLKVKS